MNKHVFLLPTLLLLFLSLNTFGQRSDQRVYTDSGWWTLGLTGGAAYQSSDICTTPGWGAGIDLAKNIYHRPNGLLDVDLRGRLLYTQTYGADHERFYGVSENPALNGTYNPLIDYTTPNGPGFTFMNHQTHFVEGALEGVLTANRLRENTGVILQGFGGLGINVNQSFTNQLRGGAMYDWSEIDSDRNRWNVLNQLSHDGDFETTAAGHDMANVSISPALGLGLGYQLTRNFSVGLEHKTNWMLHDNLEGQEYNREDNTLSTDNDLHHYTSLYLRWRIGDRYKEEPNPTVYNDPMDDKEMTTYPGYGNAPIITFTKPKKEFSTVSNDRISVTATIEHVDGRNNINATFNGKPITSYTYSTRNDKFATVLLLEPGNNNIEITATNQFGQAVESRVVIYEQETISYTPDPTPTPNTNEMRKYPKVRITRPTSNPYNSEAQIVRLKAEVEHVSNKSDITFKINGKRTYNFDFDGYLGSTITADIPLETETTNVSIRVTNAYGNDTDEQRIVYCPPGGYPDNTGPRPSVRISSPSANPYNSTENTVPVTATIEHVDNKNDITFTVNGQRKTNFNYNKYSDRFTANVTLNGERTDVVIRAVNNYGNDSDDVTIVYCPPAVLRPQVTITKPMNDPHSTSNGTERVTATVTNVDSKNDIRVKLNNRTVSNFSYSSSINQVTFTAKLEPGNNTIDIRATNSAGSDSDDMVIQYNAVERPEVDIIKPGSDPYTSSNERVSIIATVKNVDRKSDITFRVNGRITNNFNFNASSRRVTASVDLENGNNTIDIKATNEAGSDSDDTVIRYNAVERPEVTIIRPNSDPYTSSTSSVSITARVEHVDNKNDITFKVNGRTTNNFNYNPSSGSVTASVDLENGNNTIDIKATNEAGSDSDDTVVKYNRPTRPVSKPGGNLIVRTPTVTITQPHESPFTVGTTQVAILATINNVKAKRDITFTVNGRTISNFEYNANRNTFEGVITLQRGENNIIITARNGDKTASDSTVLIYSRGGQTSGQFGDTYNDPDDNNDDGGNKTSGTKTSRPSLGGLLKGKKSEDVESKKSPRSSRGND